MIKPLGRLLSPCLAAALAFLPGALALTACADDSISVKYAADYPHTPATISFVGLFKDGRVNAEAWDGVNQAIDRHLQGYPCAPLFSNHLTAKNPDFAGALDDFTRANGVGDELLDKLAPLAKGDIVAVVVMAGQPPQLIDGGSLPPVEPVGGRSGGMNGRHAIGRSSRGPVTDHNVFELAVSLYSVKTHKSVGQIAMSYTGRSVEDALARFSQRFAAETAGSSCTGWTVDANLDGEAIRKLGEEER